MSKYLVTHSYNNGISGIENIIVVEAKDEKEAKIKGKAISCVNCDLSEMMAFRFDQLYDGWAYYV